MQKPALSFAAVPGRRRRTVELADRDRTPRLRRPLLPELRRRSRALCRRSRTQPARSPSAPASRTSTRAIRTTTRRRRRFCTSSVGGRFRFGIGVSHGPANDRLGHQDGQAARRHAPLRRRSARGREAHRDRCRRSFSRRCAARWSSSPPRSPTARCGPTPRARTCPRRSRPCPPRSADGTFFIGNMIPTCISDDRDAAAAVMRKTLLGYVQLAELPQLLDRGRLRGRDARHRGGDRRQASTTTARADERSLARPTSRSSARRPQVREGVEALARRRRQHADPRSVVDARRTDGGVRGSLQPSLSRSQFPVPGSTGTGDPATTPTGSVKMDELILHHYDTSPFSEKVKKVLAHKNVPGARSSSRRSCRSRNSCR